MEWILFSLAIFFIIVVLIIIWYNSYSTRKVIIDKLTNLDLKFIDKVALEGLGFGHIMTDGNFLWNKYKLYKMPIKELINLYINLL